MGNRDEQTGTKGATQVLKALGDTLRRAAQNADALDLKPEVKAWLLDQFGSNKPKTVQPVNDQTFEYAQDVVRQQQKLEQQGKPASGSMNHGGSIKRRRNSGKDGDELPPH